MNIFAYFLYVFFTLVLCTDVFSHGMTVTGILTSFLRAGKCIKPCCVLCSVGPCWKVFKALLRVVQRGFRRQSTIAI